MHKIIIFLRLIVIFTIIVYPHFHHIHPTNSRFFVFFLKNISQWHKNRLIYGILRLITVFSRKKHSFICCYGFYHQLRLLSVIFVAFC